MKNNIKMTLLKLFVILIIFQISVILMITYALNNELTTSTNISTLEGKNTEEKLLNNEMKEFFDNNIKNIQVSDNEFSINKRNVNPFFERSINRYERKYINGTNISISYYVPNDWLREASYFKKTEINATLEIEFDELKKDIKNRYNEITYDEFILEFIEEKKAEKYNSDIVQYQLRKIDVNGYEHTIIVEDDGRLVTSYIVFVVDNYELYVELSVLKENYNDEFIQEANEILGSFYVEKVDDF